jgi:phosphoglycolate phosphatase
MKSIKTILFDLDGTLFRTDTVDIVAVNKALVLNGFKRKSDAEILDCIGQTIHETCTRFGICGSAAARKFEQDVINFELEEIERSGLIYEGADALIRYLKAKGFTICICSNGSKEYVYAVLEKFGLVEYFDEIWSQRDDYSKTAAVACLAGKHAKNGFIMIGDRNSDIDAGRENGGITIGMLHGFGGNEPFNADFTAGSIAELKKVINAICDNKIDFVKENESCVE